MTFLKAALAVVSFAGLMQSASATVINAAPLTFTTDNANAATFKLDQTYTSNVLVDFTFKYTGKLVNNTFTALWFGNSDGPNIGLKANCGDTNRPCTTNDVFARTWGQTGSWVPNSNLVEGQTYTVVGYLQKVDGSQTYNQFDAWLNPGTTNLDALAKLQHASFDVGSSSLASFGKMGVRTFNLKGQTTTYIGNINVNAVPEPGSIALMSLALAGMGVLVRRQRK